MYTPSTSSSQSKNMFSRLMTGGTNRVVVNSVAEKMVAAGAGVGGVIGLYEGGLWVRNEYKCDKNMPFTVAIAQPAIIGGALGICTASGALIGAIGVATIPLWVPYMAFDYASKMRRI